MILILWGFVFNWQWIELNIWGVTDVLSAVFRNIIIMVFDKGKKRNRETSLWWIVTMANHFCSSCLSYYVFVEYILSKIPLTITFHLILKCNGKLQLSRLSIIKQYKTY